MGLILILTYLLLFYLSNFTDFNLGVEGSLLKKNLVYAFNSGLSAFAIMVFCVFSTAVGVDDRRKLTRKADFDQLTGLYNRYAIRSAKAELKSEVADSYLNWLWWILEPICFMIIYTFIFSYIFKTKTVYFASFVFIGLTAWQFFNRMISGSIKLISSNRNLVSKVYIPKYILLLSKSYTYLFKMFISLIVTFILIVIQQVPVSINILFMVPIILVLYLISFGLGMILMHFGVYLNDLSNLADIVLRMMFYLSGVFYNIRERTEGMLRYMLLRSNPAAFLMDELRKVMLESRMPSFEGLAIWLGIALILNYIGIRIIHRNENSYVKVI